MPLPISTDFSRCKLKRLIHELVVVEPINVSLGPELTPGLFGTKDDLLREGDDVIWLEQSAPLSETVVERSGSCGNPYKEIGYETDLRLRRFHRMFSRSPGLSFLWAAMALSPALALAYLVTMA